MPSWSHLLPRYLKPAGYRSYHTGKWHITGTSERRLFDRSWGSHKGGCDWDRYFSSRPWREGEYAAPVKHGEPYYSTIAIADHAIACLKLHQEEHPDQPFFQYVAFYAPHFPLHGLEQDIAKYREAFVEGWDVEREKRWKNLRRIGIVNCDLAPLEPQFSPRYLRKAWLRILGPGEVAHPVPWESLTDEQKRYQADKMAVHAAMVDRMDREIGRVFDQIRAMGQWDNTVIFFLSDNGADATIYLRGDGHNRAAPPGSAATYQCIGPGWSAAANSPFRRHKIWTHEGGISTPLIAHWPNGIAAKNELRHDVGHIVDVVPTILELAGVDTETPEGAPPHPGRSLVPTFKQDGSGHDELFFQHEGNRGLRAGDYKLVSAREDGNRWELFNLAADRCEQKDLAKADPERLQTMIARWTELRDAYAADQRK